MKNERLIAMTDCLLNEGRMTAEEFARRFEVSVRTIYRDIDSLCAAGLPIVAVAGAGGGYEVEEGYRIDRSFLSKDEISDLTAVLKGFTETFKDRNIERSLGKISSLGGRKRPHRETDPRDPTDARVELPPPLIASLSPWGPPGPDPRRVADLRRAISETRPVAFAYLDGEGRATEREVEPFSVIMGGAVWYLHAWCRLRGAFRLFRIARISGLRFLCQRFDPLARSPVPDPFDLETSGEIPVHIVLAAQAKLKAALDEALPWASCESGGELDWTYRFDCPLGSWIMRILLSLGPGFRIIEPAELRSAIASAGAEMGKLNEEK